MVRGYLIGVAGALGLLWALPAVWWMQWIAVFLTGFFLYGPQMLIGLCGAEVVGPHVYEVRETSQQRVNVCPGHSITLEKVRGLRSFLKIQKF